MLEQRIYEKMCICPDTPCPFHPTPNRPFVEVAAEDVQRSRLVFVAVKNRVMCGKNDCWATCRSNTAAKRIARALNLHEPNRRGV
jgi:hypothetical protein